MPFIGWEPPRTTKQVFFNAPAISTSDIRRYPGLYRNAGDELETDRDVMQRKGWLTADTSFASEWTVNPAEDSNEEEAEDQSTSYAPAKRTIDLIPSNRQYGFRFMYNPPMITHSLGVMRGVNPSYTFASVEGSKSLPIVGVGSGIAIQLTINRVEDVPALRSFASDAALQQFLNTTDAYGTWAFNNPTPVKPNGNRTTFFDFSVQFDVSSQSSVPLEQAKEIRDKGTLHDLEYLFRVMMGRMYKTTFRGETADVGIATGQLLVLYLSKDMVYRVKVSDFKYTHQLFTPDMTPTLTDVSITFERIPDGYDYSEITA